MPTPSGAQGLFYKAFLQGSVLRITPDGPYGAICGARGQRQIRCMQGTQHLTCTLSPASKIKSFLSCVKFSYS